MENVNTAPELIVAKWCKDLESNIPRDAVAERDGGGSKKLSYLKAWYVIDRLNKVFGNLNWSSDTLVLNQVSGTQKPTYYAKVRIMVTLPTGQIVFKDGVGYGCDKGTQNPHEMAVKEAESDAFKRAAMKLGISMGLGLYTGDSDFIDEEEEPQPVRSASKTYQPSDLASANHVSNTHEERIRKLQSSAKILIGKKKTTKEALQAALQEQFKVERMAQLTPEQVDQFSAYLNGLN